MTVDHKCGTIAINTLARYIKLVKPTGYLMYQKV